MTTTTAAATTTQQAEAMARIRSHINRSAGQHQRALRKQASTTTTTTAAAAPVVESEGTRSARIILGEQRASLTPEPLLLPLHRVDARQLTSAPVHIVHGAVEEHPADKNQGHGLDHLAGPSYLNSVTRWLIAGAVFCLLSVAIVLMGPPQKH